MTSHYLYLYTTQGRGQGVRRTAVSLAQILGPIWASLSTHLNEFWGGMVGFTFLGMAIMLIFWKSLDPARNKPNTGESKPLIPKTQIIDPM